MTKSELDRWIDNSPYTESEEVILILRQQQKEIQKITKLMDFWKYSYNELRTSNE
jgi:hypothetical protein